MSTRCHQKCPRNVTKKMSTECHQKVSTKCHPFCPRNVTYYVHEMSATRTPSQQPSLIWAPAPITVLLLWVVSIANAQSNGIPLQRSPLGQIHCIRYGVYVLGSIPACSLAGRQAPPPTPATPPPSHELCRLRHQRTVGKYEEKWSRMTSYPLFKALLFGCNWFWKSILIASAFIIL